MTESELDVRGTRVRVLRGGEGPPLLYLHGSGDSGLWQPVLDELARDHDVIRPDHPGYGFSDEDKRIDSVHDLAFFYLDLLDELGIDRVAVIGSSLGGWLGGRPGDDRARPHHAPRADRRRRPARRGQRPARRVRARARRRSIERVYAGEERAAARPSASTALESDPPSMERYLRNRITTAHLAWNPYFHDPKLVHRLHRITAPTLVVWGSEDGLVPVAHGHRWAELIPARGSRSSRAAATCPTSSEPEQFLALVRPFSGRLSRNHRPL